MLRLFRRRRKTFDAPLAPGRRIYAVGDIHGRADLLRGLMDRILADCRDCNGAPEVVFLGDCIDRGEDSRAVLELLVDIERRRDITPIFLMGNHERMLLDFFAMPEYGARWLHNGGLPTLASYGVSIPDAAMDVGELERIRVDLASAMGRHLAFIERMVLRHRRGNVFFAHAGANPARGPLDQSEDSLLWGHPRFCDTPREDGFWVVHGHIVVEEPTAEQGRISVDTGAYFSDRLTAARIDDDEAVFISA